MNQKRSTPRYAHTEGHTDLCFSEDGNYIITCGSEGDVRIWNGIEDDDPKAVCVGEKAFAVAQKGKKLYVGSDHNYVQIYTFPEAELDGILTRFTAPVTTIDISVDSTFIAAGSSDMEIHLVETSTSTVKHFTGHKAPILHVTIDPKLEYLGSSSCDGSVRLWKINDQTVSKEWSNVITSSNSFKSAESLCHLSWEPLTGRLFAIPFGSEIKLFQRSTWNVMITLSHSQSKYSLTTWSSCGRYLAASTLQGEITVWNTLINRVISSSTDNNSIEICSLDWNPQSDNGQLAYCDKNGQLAVVDSCYPSANDLWSKNQQLTNFAFETNSKDVEKLPQEDDEDPDAISLEKIKANYSGIFETEDKNMKDDDDDGGGGDGSGSGDDDDVSIKSHSTRGRTLPLVELQPSFQPTSTPVHLQRRFMVFNDVGYIRQINTEEESMIDVDFHDAAVHHSFRINNILNHNIAALNTEALVLACEKTYESTSKLVCVLFKSWDSSKQWNTEMAENENIEAVAVGHKWLAVVTSFRYLRVFSLSGVQREIINIPGLVVCLNGFEDLLFVVYHSAMGLPGEQNLSFAIYQIAASVTVLVAAQPLPLSSKSTLKWIGFSDLFNPCCLDSDGILKLFVSSTGIWKPICSVDSQKQEVSNHYFVIGVSEERQNIRCILCKGSYYPSTTPHPFITEIPWQIPICENLIDKGGFEEKFWRCSIARECLKTENNTLKKEFLAAALNIFALSCKTGHEMRVFELCEFANEKEITDLALKYASRTRNEKLAERLIDLRNFQLQEMETENRPNVERNTSSTSNNVQDSYETYNHMNDNDSQSQELFSESRCSLDSAISSVSQQSVSLIAETKKKKSLSEQKNEIMAPRKINPFKKSTETDIKRITQSQMNSTQLSLPVEEKKNIINMSFSEWFKVEKENLKKEFPGLNNSDLTKSSVQKYKELRKTENLTNKIESENDEDPRQSKNEQQTSKKRKSNDGESNQENEAKKKSISKLQEFIFKK